MKKIIHRADTRGNANHGWLNSFHTFSFAAYQEPSRMHFGLLRVLNDDVVAAGKGFGAHPHENMEIISIPLSGALKHQDNTGRTEIIHSGDVQIMSAGSGITHSEMNASNIDPVNFLQVWIFPKKDNIPARYEQKSYAAEDRQNKFQIVVSPKEEEGGVWINQDAWFSLTDLNAGHDLTYQRHLTGNGIYLFVLDGEIEVADEKLSKRDAIGISDTEAIQIRAAANSKLLLIEVPMN
ncbi:pirin family protein [soil metagenome]